jgi:hypothetical protein
MLKTTVLCALVIYSYHCPNNEDECPNAGHTADRAVIGVPGLKSQGECESLAYSIMKGTGGHAHWDYGCWPYRAAITDGRKPYGKEPSPGARWFESGCPKDGTETPKQ